MAWYLSSCAIMILSQAKSMYSVVQVIPSFERIGDYATNLEEIGEKMHSEETGFSEKAIKELNILTGAVDEILSTTIQALTDNDTELAKTIEPLEEVIDDQLWPLPKYRELLFMR